MAASVSSDESFDDPWKGRSTPMVRVLLDALLVVPPPPHALAASATMASAPTAVIRLFIYFLSLLYPVCVDRTYARVETGPSAVVRRRTNQSTHDGLAGLRASRPVGSTQGVGGRANERFRGCPVAGSTPANCTVAALRLHNE